MYPWPCLAVGRLKGPDFVIALQRQCHFIESLKQAFTPARVDVEAMRFARRRNDRLRLEIYANPPGPLRGLDVGCESIDDLLVDNNRKKPVLKAVREENVSETRAYDGA